jgi:hypothetical protein
VGLLAAVTWLEALVCLVETMGSVDESSLVAEWDTVDLPTRESE